MFQICNLDISHSKWEYNFFYFLLDTTKISYKRVCFIEICIGIAYNVP